MDIRVSSKLNDVEIERLFKWREQVFPVEGKVYQWAETEKHILACENGQAIGHIGFGRFRIVGNTEVSVIGVGGVVVRPEFQGRKVPQMLFAHLFQTSELNAHRLCKTLFCPHRLITYYHKHGFRVYEDGFQFLQNDAYQSAEEFVFMVQGALNVSGRLQIPSNPW